MSMFVAASALRSIFCLATTALLLLAVNAARVVL